MRSHSLLLSLLLAVATLGLAACTQVAVEPPPPTRTPDPLYMQAEPTKQVVWVQSATGGTGEQPGPTQTDTDSQPAEPEPTPVPPPETCVLVVGQYGVKVRSGPGVANAEVAQVASNEEFPFLEENPNGDWFRIQYPDAASGQAWVAGIYAGTELTRKVDCSS